jgi:hypothetical protein
MIPKTVIVSSNLNELYIDFWEMVYKSWKHINIEPFLILILESHEIIPESLMYKENIIPFYVRNNINTAFVSQCIRLLYPAIINDFINERNSNQGLILNNQNSDQGLILNNQNSDQGLILISDMDIIPMNNKYFNIYINESIKDPYNSFYVYRSNILKESKQIAMCYNAGSSNTWKKLFNINNIEEIYEKLNEWYNSIEYSGVHGGKGWSFDQEICSSFSIIELTDNTQMYNRLDREQFEYLLYNLNKSDNIDNNNIIHFKIKQMLDNIKDGLYSDYHMLRPYKKFKYINDICLTNFINSVII